MGLGDDCQGRGVVGRHQVADIQLPQADPPGDGRADLGEFEVELGVVDRRLVGLDRALVLTHQRRGGVEGLLGNTVFSVQAAIPLKVYLGIFQLGLVLQQRAFGLEQGVLVRTRVDLGQQVPGLDHLPFFESDLDQFATHAAAHVDGIEGRDRAQRLVVQREIPGHRRRHPHRNRPRSPTEPWPHATRAPHVPRRGFIPCPRLLRRATGPELPGQRRDHQYDEQAEQPATGIAGNRGLHGVINHWARGLLYGRLNDKHWRVFSKAPLPAIYVGLTWHIVG